MIVRYHYSVMLEEVLNGMEIQKNNLYLDCTFGQGGYSKAILDKGARVVAFDQDSKALPFAEDIKQTYGDNFTFVLDNFSNIDQLDNQLFDGIVFDLGLSSTQIQDEERGFSFHSAKSLNMKMSNSYGQDVEGFLNTAKEEDIANVLYENADEYKSRRIARAIVKYRDSNRITTSAELAKIVSDAVFKPGFRNVATKTFQALRIWANDEIGVLRVALSKALQMLKSDGILCVVSFHSGEDRVVKSFIRENMTKINKKVVKPSRAEVVKNPASRSAVMRLAKQKVEL